MKKTIFIIEDDADISGLIALQFNSNEFEVKTFVDAESALEELTKNPAIKLFLVDWMLIGKLSGLEFIKKLREIEKFKEVPVIMITAYSQPENIIQGLDAGADDYITKPFDLNVLKARIRVQLRLVEEGKVNLDILQIGPLKIEKQKCKVFVEGEEINLTSTEYKILTTLLEKPGHVFTRAQLLMHIQGENIFVTGRTIDTHIASLRKKLGIAYGMIETIRGIGYRFKDE